MSCVRPTLPFGLSLSGLLLAFGLLPAQAFLPPQRPALPNFDSRVAAPAQALPSRQAALQQLQAKAPAIQVDFDPITGSPKWVRSAQGFLTGPAGQDAGLSPAAWAGVAPTDPHRLLKAFLNEHAGLFGHGAEALQNARMKREFVTPHNGLQTVVFEQLLDGIPVFEGLLVAHTTQAQELVSVANGFVPDPAAAAELGTPQRQLLQVNPAVSAAQAVALAAQNLGEELSPEAVNPLTAAPEGAPLSQSFQAPGLQGQTVVQLVWLPLDGVSLRLCWEVLLTSRSRGELFRLLIDATTGQARLRHCLTSYLTEATYRVFTSDSPSPFSPGNPTPSSYQPPVVDRSLVSFSALDTTASPNGWIDDGVNETRGNNVDAHTDRNNDNLPDLPRPQGSPARVFDFALDLGQSPTTYANAAVVQLFYWNNWMHDQLYGLGFTEAAGNFQNNNFGRGGLGNDAVQADAQDGGGYNNANFSTPPDGYAGRMQMYLFSGPSPDRDGDLDAEIILHEYTHGLSNRRVGGGVGLYALQSAGMGEGWSDFYALSLLSQPADDPAGVYASGGYATYLLGGLSQNYYYGIRRYPYCTDLNKNPLTFKDIDRAQASSHAGVPRSPIIGSTADEVHNMGEVWCVTLWEARASLVYKLGGTAGNRLMLQLVTDGMNLAPANPNFLQARDAILQADRINTGGTNQTELWAAFAKRGMGPRATSPSSSTTVGLHESFDLPGVLYGFGWEPVSSPQIVDQPFNVTLTALDGLGQVVSNFTGPVSLSCSTTGSPPSVAISPTTSGSFVDGRWTGSLRVLDSVRGAVLKADDGRGHVALSAVFNTVASNAPPVFLVEPASQAAQVGRKALFLGEADGTPPLTYQWTFYATNLPGATATTLSLTNVEYGQAGPYALLVSNAFGWVSSSNALLTVMAAPPCAPPLAGLLSWWRAEGNADDEINGNHGVLSNGVGFAAGLVQQAFSFNGTNSFIEVPDSPALRLTNELTIEFWVKRQRLDYYDYIVEKGGDFTGGTQNYAVALHIAQNNYCLHFPFAGGWRGAGRVGDTNWHHCAVTARQGDTDPTFYIDGVLQPVSHRVGAATLNLYPSTRPLHIGAQVDPVTGWNYFSKALVDELAFYNRVLSAAEIQAIYAAGSVGKCPLSLGPSIVSQPESQTVALGSNATFTVVAAGTSPLSYQWFKDGVGLAGATGSALDLSQVQTTHAGLYAVQVSNLVGSVLSSNASLTVALPPRVVRHPVRQLVQPGCGASFQVVVAGTGPFSYQWLKNGQPLSGQTSVSLSLPGVQTNDLGRYSVVVTTPWGGTTSSSAWLAWNHGPVATLDFLQRFAAGGLRVRASTLVTNDIDADADELTVTGVSRTSAAGGTVSLSDGWILYQPPIGFTNTDCFSYTVADGHCYGWADGLVLVGVCSDNTPVCSLNILNLQDGSLQVELEGAPGVTYRLQSAVSPTSGQWEDLAVGTTDGFGVHQFIQRPPTNSPVRFYRAVWP